MSALDDLMLDRVLELVQQERGPRSQAVAQYMGLTDPNYDCLAGLNGPALRDLARKRLAAARRGTTTLNLVDQCADEVVRDYNAVKYEKKQGRWTW